ncbi:ATP-binding cassette domain-containing protein [Gordonia sp. zg691]|uniref:ATP-binding cassette domain-containing protein n=2 Tax=Gordonia jinghuaiqii TaxID=2758710 RepID=A0A7D7LZA6_9ACTN|nr:ATP-binding cassette domain-containing protein [Gordonia jinghuaiqii]MCR5979481.1 ATP-binding cassette domain-containing protein [Gordonia jinghuaiqii]QMT03995.1 ATP-binding cassette domain-containing protein [Gordonia jinghuaiqii]
MRPADEAGDPGSPESIPSGRTTPEPARPETMGTVNAIEVHGLHKRFKDVVAVDSVSFNVPAGSIVALLGPNGAGKTTVVNMLCTLLAPSGGTATVAGHDVVEDAADVRRSIMLTGQFAALDEALTGAENLVLFGRLLGLPKSVAKERAADLLEQFGLTAASDRRVREYSGGMRRRIDIACGLVTMPKVVFLDEPTTGLDPRSRQEVWTLVSALRDRGVTTLLTTQYLEEADALSDRIVVIDRGRVIAEGTADELKDLIGTSYCQVTPVHVHDLPKLRELLADLIGDESQPAPRLPLIDSDDTGGFGAVSDSTGDEISVAVPAPDGAETLVEIVRRTASADIRLSDVALRRPSLDEVFLALTDPTRYDASALSPATEPA